MMNRAYSLIEIKAVKDDARIMTGTATTPLPDRIGDVVEPLGVKFKNPMPLLLHHRSDMPVGTVRFEKPTADGIDFEAQLPIATVSDALKSRIDEAWESAKLGLVRGVSIGFKNLESSRMESGGTRFLKTEVLELSLVTIPANAEATIDMVKSIDTELRQAASGPTPQPVVVRLPPGVSGKSVSIPKSPKEGKTMTTIAEQIVALENKRAASSSRMESVMQKTLDEGRTSKPEEQEEFDTLQEDVKQIDGDLVRLRQVEKAKAYTAMPIKADTPREAAVLRGGSQIIVKPQPKLAPGQAFAQTVKCLALAQKTFRNPAEIAAEMYGPDSIVVGELTRKAAVPAGTTVSGNWAANLVGEETGAVADFVEWLRPQTILGRFGAGGVPSLRSVMFRVPLITQTSGGAAYWTGESKAKPLTSLSFTRTTLEPLKVASICALTMESVRFSSPKADMLVRDSLGAAVRERLDIDFIDPTKTAVAGISPASITNGAETIGSSGDDADAIRLDIRSVWAKYTAENNPPSSGVWVMSSNSAVALAMMTNPLGQPEFGSMSLSGGTLMGMPVIASDYVTDIVVLVNANDVYLADDGEVSIDASREASLEMSDAPAHDSGTPTPATLVSMWQTNSIAIRAERVINWLRRRDPGVVYLTSVGWGGTINTA